MVRYPRGQILMEFVLVITASFLLCIILTAHTLSSWRMKLDAERITKTPTSSR